jgi:hypothetical protein
MGRNYGAQKRCNWKIRKILTDGRDNPSVIEYWLQAVKSKEPLPELDDSKLSFEGILK